MTFAIGDQIAQQIIDIFMGGDLTSYSANLLLILIWMAIFK